MSLYDNVSSQHRLVTELFGIERIAMVVGWSMGAQQTYQWGALYPDMVERIAPICGSARTSRHNFVFLEGVKAALTADDAWNNGWYDSPPYKGLRAMGRVYAGWAVSQAFYREEVYLDIGYSSLEDYLVAFWEGRRLFSDANNFLAMLRTWQNADISLNDKYNGDFAAALGAITAKRDCDAGAHRPVLPARGQRDRGVDDAQRGVPPHRVDLGAPGRQSRASTRRTRRSSTRRCANYWRAEVRAMPDLRYDRFPEGHYAVFTMDRPDRLNAQGAQMRQELREALAEFTHDPMRCAWASSLAPVVPSRPVPTCARWPRAVAAPGQAQSEEERIEAYRGNQPFGRNPKPFISAVNGLAIGAGMERAADCDIRIASTEAYFGLFEVKRGIMANYAINHLARLMPFGEAMYLMLTGDTLERRGGAPAGVRSRGAGAGGTDAKGRGDRRR